MRRKPSQTPPLSQLSTNPIMPYNTRRKSLSLPSLGIHVPVTHAARAAAAAAARERSASSPRSPYTPAGASMVAPTSALSSLRDDASSSASSSSKKLKRTFRDSDDWEGPTHSSEPKTKRRSDGAIMFENTPPPSPPGSRASVEMDDVDSVVNKVLDLSKVNDEIVEAVLVQLQNTGNRPHLVKELAAVLMQQLKIVQQSANPCAIVSSRLTTYLKRPYWSAASPCPLAKELEPVHPRRTYFYLTTCAHQPLPDPAHAATLSQLAHTRTVISPSLSSAGSRSSISEDADPDRRRELSPSPEVDLSSPEFDDMDDDMVIPSTPLGSLSLRGFSAAAAAHLRNAGRHHRATSPPLEKDEKEFTQTADGLQKRKLSGSMLAITTAEHGATSEIVDFCGKDDGGLFGDKMLSTATTGGLPPMTFVSSPAMRPAPMSLNLKKDMEADSWMKLDQMLEWDRSPETIELDELDGLLIGY